MHVNLIRRNKKRMMTTSKAHSNKVRLPVDCDLELTKSRFQSTRDFHEECDARREEVRFWQEQCAKRWFWERRADNQKMDDPNVMMELLYYCPCMKTSCIILDFREYHRKILGLEDHIRVQFHISEVHSCRCGTKVVNFQRFLPRKEYRERYGEITYRRVEQAEKNK